MRLRGGLGGGGERYGRAVGSRDGWGGEAGATGLTDQVSAVCEQVVLLQARRLLHHCRTRRTRGGLEASPGRENVCVSSV